MHPDRAYANAAFIPGGDAYPARWSAAAAAFRAAQPAARLGLPYGPGARQRFDLFAPDAAPRGLMLFLHGGYWLESGREDWSHLAAGALARGWAVALPSYTLAPAARITAMVEEVGAALAAAARLVAGPVVITGHSAGGHLAARLACAGALPPDLAARVARVVPISPLADLRPLRETAMNADLALDLAEAEAQSPALLSCGMADRVHVWVGGQERPAFLWHARLLAEAWGCGWTVAADRHHFDVVEDLADPAQALTDRLLAGL